MSGRALCWVAALLMTGAAWASSMSDDLAADGVPTAVPEPASPAPARAEVPAKPAETPSTNQRPRASTRKAAVAPPSVRETALDPAQIAEFAPDPLADLGHRAYGAMMLGGMGAAACFAARHELRRRRREPL
jgi:hypothetical protein